MKCALCSATVGIIVATLSCSRMALDSAAKRSDDGSVPPSARTADAGFASLVTKERCGEVVQRDTELWRHRFVDASAATFVSVATDREGNSFAASAPGGTIKLDPTGSTKWSKPFGALVATARASEVYVAGSFTEILDLDDCSLVAEGPGEAYLAELDASGTVLRCESLGGADAVTGLAADADGNAIVSGPGLGTLKVDPEGRVSWRRDLSGAVATDARGNVFVTGALTGSKAFDDSVLESAGGEDVYLAKLDAQGSFVFARRFGDAAAVQHGEAVAVDPSGNVLVSGVSEGSVDFGGGAIVVNPDACPSETWCKQAGFIAKFDSAGAYLWSRSRLPVRSMPGIASDSRGNVIVSGAYPGNVPPYRLPLLVEFDSAGNDVTRTIRSKSTLTDAGAGFGVAFDPCDNALWSLTAPPAPSMNAPSFLAKLSP